MKDSREFSDLITSEQQCECRSKAITEELKQMRLAGLEPVPEFFVLAQQFIAGTLSIDAFAQMLLTRVPRLCTVEVLSSGSQLGGKRQSFPGDVTSGPNYIDGRREHPSSEKTRDGPR
jgi:hypothetical protein